MPILGQYSYQKSKYGYWPYLLNIRIKLSQNFPAGQITTRNLQVAKTCNVMCHSKEDIAVDSANFCITSGGIRDAVP